MKTEFNAALLEQSQGHNVSSKYTVMTTKQILEPLFNQGYTVTSSVATKVRNASKQGYQKHMIRLTHNDLQLRNVSDSRPEIVVVNSYDGLSSLKLMLGIYRLVCANGMIVGSTFGQFAVRHVGDIHQSVLEGTNAIANKLPEINDRIGIMSGILLSWAQVRTLANEATRLVLPDSAVSVDLDSALHVNRSDDYGMSLWLVYNRLQEALIRGGIKYTSKQTIDPINNVQVLKHNTTRLIKSIDRQVQVNQSLWDLSQVLVA